MKQKSNQMMMFAGQKLTYDIYNSDFVDFFIKTSGYQIRNCECGWEKIRDENLNPAFPIQDLQFRYTHPSMIGLPYPPEETLSHQKCEHMTRQKMQDAWDIYTGVKTFNEVYVARQGRDKSWQALQKKREVIDERPN